MTSSRFYSKGRILDLRREILWPAAYGLMLFFSMPVALLFGLQGIRLNGYENEALLREAYETAYCGRTITMLGMGPVTLLLVMFAVMEAYHAFGYLQRAREIDFVHALPQDRGQLFRSRLLNSLICVVIPYAVCLVLGLICAAVSGVPAGKVLPGILTGIVFNMIIFLLAYAASVLAMMLTGRAMTWFFGTGVFFGYFPALGLLLAAIPGEWFTTYAGGGLGSAGIGRILLEISPLSQCVFMVREHGTHFTALLHQEEAAALPFLRGALCLAAAVLLLFLAAKLYKMRALEKAGEAMAFRKTERPIRILLVALAALAGMAFTRELDRGLGWILFGTVAAAVVSHLLIELIYRANVRKLFTHKLELAVMAVLGAVLVLVLWYDVFGYETWLPKEGSVASAAIRTNAENETYSLYTNTRYDEDVAFSYYQEAAWIEDPAVLKNAEQIALARKIASVGAQKAVQERNKIQSAQVIGGTYNGMMFPKTVATAEAEERQMSVSVTWNLTNGRTAVRQYFIPESDMKELYQGLFDDPSYKEYLFPAMTLAKADIASVEYEECGNSTAVDAAAKDEFLSTYFDELKQQTFADRGDAYPVGVLRLHLSEAFLEGLELDQVYYIEGNGDVYLRYPVYASFEKTVSLLKKAGTDPGNEYSIPEGAALHAEFNGYDPETDTYYGVEDTITDPQDLMFVRENLRPMEYTYYNTFGKGYITDLSFYYDDGKRQKYLGLPDTPECRTFADKLREELRS